MSWDERNEPRAQGGSQDPKSEIALLYWIQEFAPYGFITIDRSFTIQIWNHWMETHGSLRSAWVIGKNLLELFPDLKERRLVSHLERALNGESIVLSTSLHHYLLPILLPSGSAAKYMQQTARIAPLIRDGVVSGVVIVIEDVTEREKQGEILRRQGRRDEILSWALAHFLKTEEARKSIRQIFFKIAEFMDFDTFFLYLRDVETGRLALHTTGGIPEGLEKELGENALLRRKADFPEITIFNSVREQAGDDLEILKKVGLAAAITIPLFANDRSLGLVGFGSWNRHSIASEESDLLSTIGKYLATAVDRENTNLQLKKAQVQLSEYAQLLETKVRERTSRLEETVSELETLSYTLAHDLKAPVRGMIGYCEVLLEDFGATLPPEAKLIVQKMAHNPKRMDALINDLLQFSKISRQEIELTEVGIEPVIEDVLAMRLPGVRAAVTVKTPLHMVRAQKSLLQQVLANLIDNAVKFVEPDTTPRVEISTEAVFHTSPSTRSGTLLFSSAGASKPPEDAQRPSGIRIWVRDHGIGIPAEAHHKIFGIFERGAFATNYEGTGMGLALVARAMQRMDGNFGVESVPGKGSSFWIEFPIR